MMCPLTIPKGYRPYIVSLQKKNLPVLCTIQLGKKKTKGIISVSLVLFSHQDICCSLRCKLNRFIL